MSVYSINKILYLTDNMPAFANASKKNPRMS